LPLPEAQQVRHCPRKREPYARLRILFVGYLDDVELRSRGVGLRSVIHVDVGVALTGISEIRQTCLADNSPKTHKTELTPFVGPLPMIERAPALVVSAVRSL
jgi:hypothetical protein